MQIEAKQVGEVAMIAEPIGLKAALEFFVAVLAFASIGVRIVCRARQHERSRPIGHDRASIGALRVRLALDHDPSLGGPRPGPIPKRGEQPLRLPVASNWATAVSSRESLYFFNRPFMPMPMV